MKTLKETKPTIKPSDAAKEYRKQINRITKGIKKKGTKLNLDDLERSKWKIENEYDDRIAKQIKRYEEMTNAQNEIIRALDNVDKEIFGEKNASGQVVGYVFSTQRLLEAELTQTKGQTK